MNKKPVMKSEVGVDMVIKVISEINFYATEDAVTEFSEFGLVQKINLGSHYYKLTVDSRYDFDEVVAYMKSYGK